MNKPKAQPHLPSSSTNTAPLAASATIDVNPVVLHLTKVLGNTYSLGVTTHGAHWNVTGAGFFRLHAAFDAQYHELLEAADEIAERIRALGAKAPVSMRQLLENSSLGDPPASGDTDLVRALRDDHRMVSQLCHEALKVADEAKDAVSVDLLTGRARAHDKTAWMLTASLGE